MCDKIGLPMAFEEASLIESLILASRFAGQAGFHPSLCKMGSDRLALLDTQSVFIESLILAQDERWRHG